jgi:hypothetical protein
LFHSPPVVTENTFLLTLCPTKNTKPKQNSYKKTVVYDPLKSETYRALQENTFCVEGAREITTPVQPKVFQPNRLVPGKVRRPALVLSRLLIFMLFLIDV